MRFTMSGGFFSAFSATISLEVMLFRADRAASNAGFAAARSFSASSLTAAISCTVSSSNEAIAVVDAPFKENHHLEECIEVFRSYSLCWDIWVMAWGL